MTARQPTRKDVAEFFRLGLLAGLCKPSTVARWADSIVTAERSPHIAFIELCIAGSQPANQVQSLLDNVPGQSTATLPVQMLLGHASRLVAAQTSPPEQVLLRIYRIASLETFPDGIYFDLIRLEDGLSLARDGVYGTLAEVRHDIVVFFKEYEPFAPDNSTGDA